MDLELKPAEAVHRDFAWSLYSPFVRSNMFSGAPGRRPPADWDEAREQDRFNAYWVDGHKFIISVDQTPIGWAAIVKDAKRVCIENWQITEEWRGKNIDVIILGDQVPKWREEGLKVEASILQDSPPEAALEKVLSRLGFTPGKIEGHTMMMSLL